MTKNGTASMLDRCPKIANQLLAEHSSAYDDFAVLWGEIRKLAEQLSRTNEKPGHHDNGDEAIDY